MITTLTARRLARATAIGALTWYASRVLGELVERSVREDNELLGAHGSGLMRVPDLYGDLVRKLPPALSERLLLARQVARRGPIAYKLAITQEGIQGREDHGLFMNCFATGTRTIGG